MVSSLVISLNRGSSLIVSVTFDSKTSMLSSNRGETSHLSVFLITNPVDSGIISDSSVSWVDHQDFKEFEGRVLSNPIRVKDSETGEFSSDSFLSNGLIVLLIFKTSNSDGLEFSTDDSLWSRSFSVTSSDLDSVDNEALFGLVS